MHEVVRNDRAELTRPSRGNNFVERAVAKHGVDIGKETESLRIGDADGTAGELIHGAQLKPRAIAADIETPPAAENQPSGPIRVPGHADPRLQVVAVGAAAATHEAVEAGKLRVGNQSTVEVIDPEVEIDVVAQPRIDAHPRTDAPVILHEERNFLGAIRYQRRLLLAEDRGPGPGIVGIEWSVG